MNNNDSQRWKLSLIAVSIGFSLSANLMAADEEASKTENKVTVTGTQIKGVDLADAQPLITITADDIKNTNATSIADLLKDLGVFRGGEGSFNTSTSGALSTSTPAGMAAATLRGLGASSTLTLINGRRIAASSFAAGNVNFVDVNAIPISAIDRIEVLSTGASAIYGADAVAGVVNYILKKDYSGAELALNYGNSTASSDESKSSVSFTYGDTTRDSNILITLDYFDRDGFSYADREQTASTFYPIFSGGLYPNAYWRDTTSGFGEVDPACPDEQVFFDPVYGDASCAFDPNPYLLVSAPVETLSASIAYRIDISDDVTFFSHLLVSQKESEAQSSPNRFRGLNDSANSAFVSTINPGFLATEQSFQDLINQSNGDFRIQGRFLAPRRIGISTDTLHWVAGFEGFYNEWDWEAAISYSKNESTQQALEGIYNRFTFNAALMGELCADGSTSCTAGVDGLWFNPFGGQSGNEQTLALIEEAVARTGESNVLGIDVKFSGSLGTFNGLPVAMASGVEFRQEEISDRPSELAVANESNDYIPAVLGFGSSRVDAKRDQYALFSEVLLPLSERVQLQVAGRYDHYDNFGGDFNPKVGFKWQPSDQLVIRGSWASSFRAPSLSQSGVELRTTSFSADCIAEISEFCAGQASVGGFSLEYGNPELKPETSKSISYGFFWSLSDDITLTADAWQFQHENIIDVDFEGAIVRALNDPQNHAFCGRVPAGEIGIVIDSEWCGFYGVAEGENLSQQVLNDSIADAQIFGNGDALGTNSTFQLSNVGEQTVSGFDLTYTQVIRSESAGRFTLLFDSTYLSEFDRNRSSLATTENLAGSFRYPRIIAALKLKWSYDNYYAAMAANYTHHYYDEVSLLGKRNAAGQSYDSGDAYSDPFDALDYIAETAGEGAVPNRNRLVPSWTVINTKFGVDISDDITLSIGIDNLFDRAAPFVYGRYLNADMLNHDVMGRYYRLSYIQRF
ncbi:MAG: TonB-dependent receptor [Gammaproteobacteria bacterium]|nr:TonB-dependent receptor [Gammaproteobacteria bacterium]